MYISTCSKLVTAVPSVEDISRKRAGEGKDKTGQTG